MIVSVYQFRNQAQFVRVATDTAITVDPYGEGSGDAVFMPAGSVKCFPIAAAGQVLTIATVA